MLNILQGCQRSGSWDRTASLKFPSDLDHVVGARCSSCTFPKRVGPLPADQVPGERETEPGALLDVIMSEAVLDELRREVRRRTGIATTAQALSEVIRTEIVDPKLIAKLFKA